MITLAELGIVLDEIDGDLYNYKWDRDMDGWIYRYDERKNKIYLHIIIGERKGYKHNIKYKTRSTFNNRRDNIIGDL